MRRWVFLAGLVVSTFALLWMQSVPHGNVLTLELLAPTRGTAGRMLGGWPIEHAREYVLRDFPYLATYWVPLAAAASWAGLRRPASLPLVASALDVVENVLLLRQIDEVRTLGAKTYAAEGTAWLAPLTTVVAWAKWLVVLFVVGYVLRAAVRRRRRQASTTAS